MLETIHEYAREKLSQSDESDEIQLRHAKYFVKLAERAEVEFHGAKQEYWYARLMDELDNIRIILNWTLDGKYVELSARLIAALREFWYMNGLFSESTTWLEGALNSEMQMSPTVRTKILNTYSRLAYARGKYVDGEFYGRQALSLAREINDKESCAWALDFLSSLVSASPDRIKEAIESAEESLKLFRELDHKAGCAAALNSLGELARLNRDYSLAGRYYQECLTLSNEMDNNVRKAFSLGNLSYVAYHQGNYDQALDYSRSAMNLLIPLQMDYAIAIGLAMIAGPIDGVGDHIQAANLLAAAERLLEAMGASIQPGDQLEFYHVKNVVKQELGEAEFKEAWTQGRAMSMEQALALALGETS